MAAYWLPNHHEKHLCLQKSGTMQCKCSTLQKSGNLHFQSLGEKLVCIV